MAKRRRAAKESKELNAAEAVEMGSYASGTVEPGLPPEARPIKPPPAPAERGPSDPLIVSVEAQRSYYTNAAFMAASSAMAYQLDPVYQIQMRRDPDIESSGQAIWLPVACADWSVEHSDKEDERQKACADWLASVVREIPNLTDMRRHLMLAEWYGTSGVNFVVDRHPTLKWAVKKWVPIHGDTIVFDIWGNPGMRVGAKYTSSGYAVVDMGFNSWAHIFDDLERQSVIVHSVFREAPFFDDSRSADQMFRGTGNRDRCWYYWYLKQEIMQQAAIWCKRYAAGIRIGRYPSGNAQAQQELMQVLANLINDNNVALPRVPGETPDTTDIEIKEATASRATMFMDLINWLSAKVKEVRQGQSLTSESHGTGLGSGVASAHENTKSLYLKYHADALSESETVQMLWPLARMRGFPAEVYRECRMAISTERPAVKERMDAAKTFIDMGGSLRMDEVRAITGFTKPAPGDEVLTRGSPDLLGDLVGAGERAGGL